MRCIFSIFQVPDRLDSKLGALYTLTQALCGLCTRSLFGEKASRLEHTQAGSAAVTSCS